MHREVLSEPAAKLFPSLSRFPGFYLAGGTALALQIGHRVSVDFDLFCDGEIDRVLLQRVRRVFGPADSTVLVNNADELTLLVNGVKITFLLYPFPPREPLVVYEGVQLLSVREIATTKAYTIGRRGAYKDYVDLYFVIAENHIPLPAIITSAELKFGADFNSRLFLAQLVYVADLDDTEIQFLKPLVTPRELVAFFLKSAFAKTPTTFDLSMASKNPLQLLIQRVTALSEDNQAELLQSLVEMRADYLGVYESDDDGAIENMFARYHETS